MVDKVEISSRDYWVKIVEFLQQNWALIEPASQGRVIVYFISDTSRIFDQISFDSADEAEIALIRNRFQKFNNSPEVENFLRAPVSPFVQGHHPNGPIYSSGRFWI